MAKSIKEIAIQYESFLLKQLEQFEKTLHPSSTEDEDIVRRASFAVRNKAVQFERFIPFSETLYITIQDVRAAEVRILFSEEQIVCSCKQADHCRHKLAAILALYQFLHSVQDWAANWRAKKNVQLSTLATKRSPESWLHMVNEVMGHILQGNTRVESYVIPMLVDNARAKLNRHMPFEHEWRTLYKLFIELAMLNHLWSHLNKTNSSVNSSYFQYFIEKEFDLVITYTDHLNDQRRLFAAEPFYDALQIEVRKLALQEKGFPQMRLDFYLYLWETILLNKERASQELAIVEQVDVETDLNAELLPLLCHIILQNEEQVNHYCKLITLEAAHEVLSFASYALNIEETEAAATLLTNLLPQLGHFINEIVPPMQRQPFIRHTDSLYAQITMTEQQRLQLYGAYGKYGVHPYADYLLRAGDYEQWVALNQLYSSSLAHLEATGLKKVLEHAPAVALPLYHHYAMIEIRQKSRMNYKQAVRIWKSMKAAAKKAGKLTYFEQYMETIQQQYKRLRALQEEIEKSNLLV